MLIISDFKDCYDSMATAYGVDKSRVFRRFTSPRGETDFNSPAVKYTNLALWNRDYALIPMTLSFYKTKQIQYFLFAERNPQFPFSWQYSVVFEVGLMAAIDIIYAKMKNRIFRSETISDCLEFLNTKHFDFTKYHDESPIIVMRHRRTNSLLTSSPLLSTGDCKITGIFPIHEIYTWVDTALGMWISKEKDANEIHIDDKHRIDMHGFDEVSFRPTMRK